MRLPSLLVAATLAALASPLHAQPLGELSATPAASGAVGPERARVRLIESSAQLALFFDGDAAVPPAARALPLDYDRQWLLGIALGWKAQAGHAIAIERVERNQDGDGITGELLVHYRVTAPAAEAPLATTLARPYLLVKIPACEPGDAVRFVRSNPPPARPFEFVQRTRFAAGGNTVVRIDGAGRTAIQRDGQPLVLGKATASQLQALRDAVGSGRLGDLPQRIAGPAGGEALQLRVHSTQGANRAALETTRDHYQRWDAQLRPLMNAIDAIESAAGGTPPPGHGAAPRRVRGTLRVSGGWWGLRRVTLESQGVVHEVSPAGRANELVALAGEEVVLSGTVTPRGPDGAELILEALVRPRRGEVAGTVRLVHGVPHLDPRGPGPHPPGYFPTAEVAGPAQTLAASASGQRVTAEGFVYDGPHGEPLRVVATALQATVDRPIGPLRAGEPVRARRLSSSRRYLLIQRENGRYLWLRAGRVDLSPAPAGPPRTSGSSGLAGSRALDGR